MHLAYFSWYSVGSSDCDTDVRVWLVCVAVKATWSCIDLLSWPNFSSYYPPLASRWTHWSHHLPSASCRCRSLRCPAVSSASLSKTLYSSPSAKTLPRTATNFPWILLLPPRLSSWAYVELFAPVVACYWTFSASHVWIRTHRCNHRLSWRLESSSLSIKSRYC